MRMEARIVHRKEVPHMKSQHYRKLFAKPRVRLCDFTHEEYPVTSPLQHTGWIKDLIKHALIALDFGFEVLDLKRVTDHEYIMTSPDLDPMETAHAFDVEIEIYAQPPKVTVHPEKTQPFSDW